MPFLLRCLNPSAIMVLFVAITCFSACYTGYRSLDLFWFLWLALGILAIVSWFMLVAS